MSSTSFSRAAGKSPPSARRIISAAFSLTLDPVAALTLSRVTSEPPADAAWRRLIPCLRSPSTAALMAWRTFSATLTSSAFAIFFRRAVTSSCPIFLKRKMAQRLWMGSMRFEE